MPVFGEQQQKKGSAPIINEIVGRVNDNTKRLRILEQRERLLTSRISSTDESVYQKINDLESSLKELSSKLASQDERIAGVENRLKEVVKQLQYMATKSEVKKLDEKLRLFDPLKSQVGTSGEGSS
jgi:uncharacterized protein (DUF3084 family)